MQSMIARKMRSILIFFLLSIVVLTGIIPGTLSKSEASSVGGGGITLTGFSKGTISDPYIHYDSKITLKGTYVGITGENLRLSIRNNGQTDDLITTRPYIESETSTFTFSNIGLKPGMNEVNFYVLRDSGNQGLFTFYVIYNTTPGFSNLKINNELISADVEKLSVAYMGRRAPSLTGIANNANTVKVTNLTTGQVFDTSVGSSGSFGLDVDLNVGLNTLRIQGFSNNKEVNLIERKVIYTSEFFSQGSNDILYNLKMTFPGEAPTSLETGKVTVVEGYPADAFTLSGEMFVHEIPGSIEPFKLDNGTSANGQLRIIKRENGSLISGDGVDTTIPVTVSAKEFIGEFRRYTFTISGVKKNTGLTEDLVEGKEYQLEFHYPYKVVEVLDGQVETRTERASIRQTPHSFSISNPITPRFAGAVLTSEGNLPISTTTPNLVRSTPFTIDLTTKNITNVANLQVEYASPDSLAASDYEVTKTGTNTYQIIVTKPPSRETTVTIKYPGAENFSFKITPDIIPHVQLSYASAGKTIYVENGFEITDLSDPPSLTGKVSNYAKLAYVKNNKNNSNINVTVDGEEVEITVAANDRFTISSSKLKEVLEGNDKSGIRVLEIRLTNDPVSVFKYNISYVNKNLPKIEDISLKVLQNKDEVKLTKKSTDTAYTTTALYLSEFSFKVDHREASHVTVKKDGQVIAVYDYVNDEWKFDVSNADYVKTLSRAVGSGSSTSAKLKTWFERSNFPSRSGNTFEASMSSDDFDKILNEIAKMGEDEEAIRMPLFPLALNRGGTTTFEIEAAKDGIVTREKFSIQQTYHAWQVISPIKADNEPYITVNANSVPIKVFAEKATKVMFGKTEAVANNTTDPDYEFNERFGRPVPQTYYVFEAVVPLKPGLNTIKYTVEVNGKKNNDEVKIYNASSSVEGAEYRDVLGKKVSFSVFDKALELKFPNQTVLLNPPNPRAGNEIRDPSRDIYVDVPLYFGIADRTSGATDPESKASNYMEDILAPHANFNYASPLYYIDAGDIEAPAGREPYFNDEMAINGKLVDAEAWWKRYEDNLVPSKQGTLTIQYDASIVNAANTNIAIFYHGGEGWENIGGTVNTGKKTVTVPFKGFGYYMVMKIRNSFPDVVRHDFARDAIETLYSKGIMNPASNSTFGTELKISRGEFATMIVKALGLPINAGPYDDRSQNHPSSYTFTDVDQNYDKYRWDWSYEYIETAARAGIVRGKDAHRFFPDDPLTREEAAIIIARALNLKTGTPEAAQLALTKTFTDGQLTGHYAAPAVLAVTKAKIMNGEPNDASAKKPTFRFNPRGDLTRAEMAIITYRIMVQLKKIPK